MMIYKIHTLSLSISLFIILLTLIQPTYQKNYEFEVTYQCQNDQFKWLQQKLKNQTVYGCKHWIQKILIKQQQNKYVRFQSKIKQQQQQIEQDEQKDFQQEQQKEQQQQQKQKQQQQEEEEKEIQELQQQEEKQKQKQGEKQQSTKGQQQKETSTNNNQQKQNKQTKISTSNNMSTAKAQASSKKQAHHKLSSINNKRRLLENQYHHHHQLTPKLSNIFHKSLPINTNNRHKLQSFYSFSKHQNQITHYFQLRHTEEQEQGQEEQEKFKPIKAHRSHPVDDIMFLLQVIEMNSIVLQRTYQLNYEDIPTLEQLEEKKKEQEKQREKQKQAKKQQKQKQQKQQKQHYLTTKTNHKLRSYI